MNIRRFLNGIALVVFMLIAPLLIGRGLGVGLSLFLFIWNTALYVQFFFL